MRLGATDRTLRSVVAVTALALLARLAWLGSRVAHFDEGRVAYWTLEYARTGTFQYRAVLHGPLLQHVNRRLFAVLGPTDLAIRLFPAVVTGLLPLAAVLFRSRLSDREVTALALVLAFEPLLLYYGRFSRSDPLVVAFALVALGLCVRALDDGTRWHLAPAVWLLALGFGAKENALLYPVAWLGALLLVADLRLLASGEPLASLRAGAATVRRALRRGAPPVAVGVLGAVVLLFVLYAPRAPGPEPGIGDLLADPSVLPALLDAVVFGAGGRFVDLWLAPNSAFKLEFSYVFLAGSLLRTLFAGATVVTLLGIGGVLADRYLGDPRAFVQFAGSWALLSVVGYPAVADVPGDWIAMHVVVALAVPASVALAGTYALARDRTDRLGHVAAATLVLVAASGAGSAAYTSYVDPEGPHELAQGSQPHGDLSALREGPDDLLVYGPAFVDGDDTAPRRPACADWFATLPLGWYTERANTTVTCVRNASTLPDPLPPVVVAQADAYGGELAARTADWRTSRVAFRRHSGRAVILVDPERAAVARRVPKR